VAQILAWADEHHRRTGGWPSADSGPVAGAPGESWRALNSALRDGFRGLPGGDSLASLLRRERGLPERRSGAQPDYGRHVLAAQLRAGGLTLAEVGKYLGVTKQAVVYLLRRAEQEGKQP
jgi:hypothetical protein